MWDAVDGRVLIYIHKKRMLDRIMQRYPAGHYVMIDDKRRILAAMKDAGRGRLTTVFARQGHHAFEPVNIASNPPAAMTVDSIGDLVNRDCAAFLHRGAERSEQE